MAVVRYIVSDVTTTAAFYVDHLGFDLVEQMGGAIAMLRFGDLTLWLAGLSSSAARPMPNGDRPEPGGWNRIVVEVDDIAARVEALRAAGVPTRNEIVTGPGGKQILIEDPSGNPIELFQARGAS
jgi:catechol 2,3-dioxygenase-like lactoylglutathione lyase family enzyme